MILRRTMWLILAIPLAGCAPLQKKGGEQNAIEKAPPSEDGEQVLKIAFSMDDISAVEIIPKKLQVEPWQPVQLFLAGLLPDKTQGRIPSEVTWKSSDPEAAIVGETGGELIAKKAGDIVIQANFRDMQAERTIKVQWLSKLDQELSNPEAVNGTAVDGNIVQLQWRFGDGPVTGHQIAYREGEPPETCESTSAGVVVVPAAEIADLTEVTIMGLQAVTTYGFRLCSVQELATEDQIARRFSVGVPATIKTKTE